MDELKFILIEEIQDDAELIQKQLRKEFTFSLRVVTNQQELIENLRDFTPDVILSSFYSKIVEDFWTLTIRNELLPDTPFIVLTPTFKDEVAIDCINKGVTNYVSKKHLVRLNFVIKVALNLLELKEQKKSVEKKLEERLEHFKKFVVHDISGDYLGKESEILFCNDKVLEIFEFDNLEDLNAYGSYNLYEFPEDRLKLINDLKKYGKIENREFRMHTKTGRSIIVLENAFADFDKDGQVIAMYGYLIDITKQRQSEEQLLASETLFRTLIEGTSASMAIYNEQYLLYTNPAFNKLVGYSSEELVKMHYWDVVHPDDKQLIQERGKKRVNRQKVASEYEFRILTKNGEVRWVEFKAIAINYKNHNAAVATFHDITEQKNAAQEIKKLSTVIEQSPLSIIITDIKGNIEYVNRAFINVTGYEAKEVIGKNPRILKSGHTAEKIYEELWKNITSGMVWKGDLINKKKDGSIYIEVTFIFPIFDEDGKVIHYAAIKRDVTKEKEIERELLKEKKKAEEASRLKSGILTNMSHELRTPLNGILGFSTLISDSSDLGEIREMVGYVQESGKRLLRTLNLIIEISAMESGNFTPDYQEVDMNDVLRRTVKDFKEEAENKNLKLVFADTSTPVPLNTDLRFTHGAIENIVDNAIKFTNEGGIKISAGKKKRGDKEFVAINIEDTGIGISEKNQKSIFEDFQQESMGYNRGYEGTGLGLSLAKKYIELLGGFIELKSKVGEGSTFSILIPVKH